MKKLTTFLLALLLCCSVFVACSNNNKNSGDSTPVDSSSSIEEVSTPESSTPDSSIEEEESALESAAKYVRSLYIMDSATTAANYYVIAQAKVGEDTFAIEWSVDVTEGAVVAAESDKEGMTLIQITRGAADVNYVLTATLTDGNESKSVSFNRVVPAFEINTYAQYAASENGDPLTIRGIVIGWEDKARGDSANSIYLQDLNNEGGYYLYSLSELPAGLALGVTIEASGEFENYKGTFELKNVSAKIIDSEANPVAPVDYTEAFINAANTMAAELVSRQAMLVTLKGVTITDQDAENGYLNFTLGGKTAYLRISSTHNCITKAEQADMIDLHAASFGSIADVTGYVAIYSGAFYLVPVDANAISNIQVPDRTDAEKIELEKGALKVTDSISSDTTLTLPVVGATYENVAISWASNSDHAVVNGGNVAITVPDEKTTITLTATLTLNDATDSASFEVVLNKIPTAIKELNALGAAQEHNTYTDAKYIAEGVITKLIVSGSYGNLYIKDNNGDELYIYGLYVENTKYGDYTGTKPVEGDYVRVIGKVGQYNGTAQMKNADLMTFATPHNVASALALTEGKAYVVATVKEVYNASYGNMYLTDDGENSFTIYGSYDVFGNRYDKLAVKPEAGDTIGVYGEISSFNGAPQIKNGVIFYWVKGEAVTPTCPGCEVEGEEHAKCTVCGEYTCNGEDHSACKAITTIAGALAADDGAAVEIKGIVVEINYSWSSDNMSVTITDGTNKLYIYQLATEVALNDVITVTGTVGNYYGAKQIAAGATAVIEGQHTEHTYANGLCTACGATQPIDATLATLAYTAGTTTNMKDGNNATTVGLDASIFTVTSDKGNQEYHVGLNKNNDFRLYAGNCALTVSVANGYSIVKIKLNFASSNASAEFTVNGTTYTPDASLVDINASSFVIVNTGSGQLRFASIEIYYVQNGGDAPVVPAKKCECGADEIHTATCEYCSKLLCVGDHSACAPSGGDETPAELFTKVTSASQLVEGATILITYKTYAMSALHQDNYFTKADGFNAEDDSLNESFVTITLEKVDGNWVLKLSDTEYVAYTTAGKNKAYVVTDTGAHAQWTISIDSTGNTLIESVGTAGRYLQYNAASPRFACYTGTQEYPTIYIVNG